MFLNSRIEFLGSSCWGGIHTADSMISALKNIPTPKSSELVRSFLCQKLRDYLFNLDSPSQKGHFLHMEWSPVTVSTLWNMLSPMCRPLRSQTITYNLLCAPKLLLVSVLCLCSLLRGNVSMSLLQNLCSQCCRVLLFCNALWSLIIVWALKHFRDIIFR